MVVGRVGLSKPESRFGVNDYGADGLRLRPGSGIDESGSKSSIDERGRRNIDIYGEQRLWVELRNLE